MLTHDNYSLLHHNTMGIAARCARFIEYATVDELALAARSLRCDTGQPLPWLHIGQGSNLLFVGDYPGTVLHSAIRGIEVKARDEASVLLRVGAGECWDELVATTLRLGAYGLENLSLIPGEVGAAAVQNIGAYGSEAAQYIERVETLDMETLTPRCYSNAECDYGYRHSLFKTTRRGRDVVTHVWLRLHARFTPDLGYGALRREIEARRLHPEQLTVEALRDLVIEIRRGKLPDPQEVGSAGSFFMNPVVDEAQCTALLHQYPAMPHFPAAGGWKVPAGWLIEQCGWKGKSLGRAGVYEKQALVLVNRGGATGSDIATLAARIQADVQAHFGITIRPEVNYIE